METSDVFKKNVGYRSSQWDGDGVADLPGDGCAGADEAVRVGESLQERRLVVGDGAVLHGVEVAALLRLEELGPDRHGGAVPVQTSHDVHGTGGVPEPAGRLQVVRKIRPIPALGDRGKALA